MSQVIAAPEMLLTAAGEVKSIGSAINAGGAAAAGSTTGVLAAAEDEVSTAISALFSEYAEDYHTVLRQAATFHTDFTRALAAAGAAYTQAEAAATQVLLGSAQTGTNTSGAIGAFTSVLTTAATPVTALIMSGTTVPVPSPSYISAMNDAYILPRFFGAIGQGLTTPEQLWPGFGNLTMGQSVAKGVQILNDALLGPGGVITSGHNAVVFGYSQSAEICTEEIKALMALPAALRPDPSQLSFILIGDLDNPDGGFFARFPGFYVPYLDIPFPGATPPNSPYPTYIYTNQYDGWAHFPQYPLNIVSDVNAIMGIHLVHGAYPSTAADVANAIPLPTSPGYAGNTHYYMFLTQNLPITEPIRNISVVGPALADSGPAGSASACRHGLRQHGNRRGLREHSHPGQPAPSGQSGHRRLRPGQGGRAGHPSRSHRHRITAADLPARHLPVRSVPRPRSVAELGSVECDRAVFVSRRSRVTFQIDSAAHPVSLGSQRGVLADRLVPDQATQ